MTNIASKLAAGFDQLAFLLDVDGTLLDLAPTPREVRVPPGLRETLSRLWQRSGGAVAFVSGRLIEELDLIFSPLQLPAVGGHGAELRPVADGEISKFAALAPLDPLVDVLDPPVEPLRQGPGDGALASAHEPHQVDLVGGHARRRSRSVKKPG